MGEMELDQLLDFEPLLVKLLGFKSSKMGTSVKALPSKAELYGVLKKGGTTWLNLMREVELE